MTKYLIQAQNVFDERSFDLVNTNTGEKFLNVDIYTDGKLPQYPDGADASEHSWRVWLSSFVGKHIEVEYLAPRAYFTGGETKIVD